MNRIPMECIRCGVRVTRAIPGDPSYEIPCPEGCPGRLAGAVPAGLDEGVSE